MPLAMLSSLGPAVVPASAALVLTALGVLHLSGSGRLERHHRGSRVLDGRRARRRIRSMRRHAGPEALTLAGVPLSRGDEVRHFKLIGTTGTGKSSVIRELLEGALRRGDRAVIADPDAVYLEAFHHPPRGDVVLNPFRGDSLCWNPFAEYAQDYDAEQLASALIAGSDDAAGREWRGYARTLLSALLRSCGRSAGAHAGELWRLLALASPAELRLRVRNTPAQSFLDPENARMFASIRSVACSAAAALEHVQAQRAAPFSIRQWVQGGRGVLFLPYEARQIAALRSMIASWVRLAIFAALSGAPEHDQRLWFVVDELDALGAIDGLKDALARLRKFGGRCILGFQSLTQVSGTYGTDAHAIVENCTNSLILRCSASEQGGTSQFAARLIGEREVLRPQLTRGHERGGGGWTAGRRSFQRSTQHITEAALLGSELEQLPDLCGFLKTASCDAWLRVRIRPPVSRPKSPRR